MESTLGAVQTGTHWVLWNIMIALCVVHGKNGTEWTPRYVAMSAFKKEALGAIEKKLISYKRTLFGKFKILQIKVC